MGYITIYTTNDQVEISRIKHLLEKNEIVYQVLGGTSVSSARIAATEMIGIRVQVLENEIDRAKNILENNGFLGQMKTDEDKKLTEPKLSKWMFIFLAALVLIIVSFLILWFMNP